MQRKIALPVTGKLAGVSGASGRMLLHLPTAAALLRGAPCGAFNE